jgi:hypothetical protein
MAVRGKARLAAQLAGALDSPLTTMVRVAVGLKGSMVGSLADQLSLWRDWAAAG